MLDGHAWRFSDMQIKTKCVGPIQAFSWGRILRLVLSCFFCRNPLLFEGLKPWFPIGFSRLNQSIDASNCIQTHVCRFVVSSSFSGHRKPCKKLVICHICVRLRLVQPSIASLGVRSAHFGTVTSLVRPSIAWEDTMKILRLRPWGFVPVRVCLANKIGETNRVFLFALMSEIIRQQIRPKQRSGHAELPMFNQ